MKGNNDKASNYVVEDYGSDSFALLKMNLNSARQDNKIEGRKGYAFPLSWEQKSNVEADLINAIMKIDPYFTKKRARKVRSKVRYWDSYYFNYLLKLITVGKQKKVVTNLIDKLETRLEDSYPDVPHTSDLYYAVLKTYSDNQIKALQAFCTWYAFYKYYDGVECDEGAIAQVKELMSFKEMLETLINKEDKQEKEWLTHKYALYLATHIQGWWD